MKQIYNWQNATVFDTEADGFLEEATKLHVLSCQLSDGKEISRDNIERAVKFIKHHINNNIPVVVHYGIFYDVPLLEKLSGEDFSELMVIDTVALSWYLNVDRSEHGLDSFFEDYGIAKPPIQDWHNLTYGEYAHRCQQDVRINAALWEDLKGRLIDMYSTVKRYVDSGQVDGTRMSPQEVCYIDQFKNVFTVEEYINRILTFLMFKCDCARLQEVTRFKVDKEYLLQTEESLSKIIEAAQMELEAVMPKVAQYAKRNKPKNPFKANGELSVSGQKWNSLLDQIDKVDELGNKIVKTVAGEETLLVLTGYDEPNVNSPEQLKDWFFSLGWKPKTFKYVKDKEAQQIWVDSGFRSELKPKPRAVPQINKDGDTGKELCESVLELAEDVPEIMAYSKYSLIKHRLDTVKGFIRDMSEDGFLKAKIGGFTNTLRVKHRELVNLVGVDKPYGKEVRGVLICEDDEVLLGSDLSSLEDRVKHHFMLPHDPEYVNTMLDKSYDPHLKMAFTAGMISEQEFKDAKAGNFTPNAKVGRKKGKTTNYAATYKSGAETLARSSGMSVKEAKTLLDAYWKLNWSLKAIEEEQVVFTCARGLKWLINPINGFCYSLRKESDRFSTLCQGTGSFFFDMWVDNVLQAMQERFKTKRLCGSWHDEFVTRFRDTEKGRNTMKGMVEWAIQEVNETYFLRRDLGCDVKFGKRYSDIH